MPRHRPRNLQKFNDCIFSDADRPAPARWPGSKDALRSRLVPRLLAFLRNRTQAVREMENGS